MLVLGAGGTVNLRVEHGEVKTLTLEEIQNSVLLGLVSTETETQAPTYWKEAVQPGWGLGYHMC